MVVCSSCLIREHRLTIRIRSVHFEISPGYTPSPLLLLSLFSPPFFPSIFSPTRPPLYPPFLSLLTSHFSVNCKSYKNGKTTQMNNCIRSDTQYMYHKLISTFTSTVLVCVISRVIVHPPGWRYSSTCGCQGWSGGQMCKSTPVPSWY